MTARSGRPDALIPTAVAPATNPPGIAARRSTAGRTGGGAEVAGAGAEPAADVAVIVVWLRRQWELLETGGLRPGGGGVGRLDRPGRGGPVQGVGGPPSEGPAP